MAKVIIKCESKDIHEIFANLLLLPDNRKEVSLILNIAENKDNFEYLCKGKPVKDWYFQGEKEYNEGEEEEEFLPDEEVSKSPSKPETPADNDPTNYWRISNAKDFEEAVYAIRVVKQQYPAVRVKSNTWNLLFDQAKLYVKKDVDKLGVLGTKLYPEAIESGEDIDMLIGRIVYILSHNPHASDEGIINELYGKV